MAAITYGLPLLAVFPLVFVVTLIVRPKPVTRTTLHVNRPSHDTPRISQFLKVRGWGSQYLAVRCNGNTLPRGADFAIASLRWNSLFHETRFVVKELWRYEVIHLHFMSPATLVGWDLPLLRLLRRRIVCHYRGCEIRNREYNMQLHPEVNICHDCDYGAKACKGWYVVYRRWLQRRFATAVMVTTPDMLDFAPNAIVSGFSVSRIAESPQGPQWDPEEPLKILHVTNHPGIEGTQQIRDAVSALRDRGFRVHLSILKGVPQGDVQAAICRSHVTISKMKMGHFANFALESLALGVPTICWVRPEFRSSLMGAPSSGLIIAHLNDLVAALEGLLSSPGTLALRRQNARSTLLGVMPMEGVYRSMMKAYRS